MNHTWGKLREPASEWDDCRLETEKGVFLGSTRKPKDARRFRVAWNACEGITTETLEKLHILGLLRIEERDFIKVHEEMVGLKATIATLKAALAEQWICNHAEHCTNILTEDGNCTNPSGCRWPKPKALEAALLRSESSAGKGRSDEKAD